MHPVDFIYKNATHVFKPLMSLVEAKKTDVCATCHRPNEQWYERDVAAEAKTYGKTEIRCTACHSLAVSDPVRMGYAGKNKPVILSMLTGCGGLFTEKGTSLYLNSYYERMEAAESPINWTRIKTPVRKMTEQFLKQPPDRPFIYVTDFGRKRDQLIKNLAFSTPTALKLCSDSDQITIRYTDYEKIRQVLDKTDKKIITKWKALMRGILYGRIAPNDEKASVFWSENKELQDASTQILPDPHYRLALIRLLEG